MVEAAAEIEVMDKLLIQDKFIFTDKMAPGEKIYLSLVVGKFNKFGWNQPRTFILTSHAVYNMAKDKIKRKIELYKIDSLTYSDKSNEVIIHVKQSYDYRFDCPDKSTFFD
jgi:hypothetical protein